MPTFGNRSKKNLSEAHPLLQKLFEKVIQKYDCSVIEGHRPKEEQDKVFHSGKSKVQWPNSKHNSTPSMAVDVVPYPIDWNDLKRFYHFGGYVEGIAAEMGIDIRWGGDWDSDKDFKDQTFHDLPHFELRSTESSSGVGSGKSSKSTSYLPDGPSEADINVTLEDLERELD